MARHFPRAWRWLFALSVPLAVQAAEPLTLYQSTYRLRPGEATLVPAATETVAFLKTASARKLTIHGAKADGLVVSPSRDGSGVVLGASLLAKPGAYTVQLAATGATGEQRVTSMAVVIDAQVTVPNSATRPPVVLLNGWEAGFTNSCPVATSSSETFGNLAQYLVSDGVPVVYLFDNCLEGANGTIESLAASFGEFLNSITYADGSQVPQIDLVAHSMGGLIVRAYLAGLQTNDTFQPPTPTLVRDVVMIAVPNFGSYVAGNYALTIPAGTQDAELIPGSSLLWNLANWNQHEDDMRGVNAIGIIGNAGVWNAGLNSTTQLANAGDGVVSLTSASLSFLLQGSSTTRIVPYCHVDPAAFTSTNFGTFACNEPGIANVTSTSHPTGQIVRSFLAGTSDWKSIGGTPATDPYLSRDGGLYFALASEQNQFLSDLSAVQWGTVPFLNGGDVGTIFYDDFISGSGVLEATSGSLGSVNCGALAEPAGYFSTARCKFDATIFSIGPVVTGSALIVNSGANITIAGNMFGNSQCSGCKVQATAAGSTTTTTLQVVSWTNKSITAALPSSFSGLVTISLLTSAGVDAMNIMTVPASSGGGGPVLSVSPGTRAFTYSYGGATPAAQTVAISNSGGGSLNWTASDPDYWVSLSPGTGTAAATLSITVNPANLGAGTYTSTVTITAAGASGSPATVTVTLTVSGTPPVPSITGVGNTGDYQPAFASASWVAIFGTNLSQTTATWSASDFVNGALPASLDGVSVTIDGVPAYVQYVSPGQINVLAPDDAMTGQVEIQVTAAGQASNSFATAKQAFAPALFSFDNGVYAVAVHADGTLVGAANVIAGVASRPASAGETIEVFGTGFGLTSPALPTGNLVATPSPLANPVQVTIGGMTANVAFAGLISPGLYQLNVVVPGLASGDAAIAASIGGIQTQSGVLITIQ